MNCVLPKFLRWSPIPQYLRIWLYLERKSLKSNYVKKRSSPWTLMQYNWCSHKNRKVEHRCTQREDCEDTGRRQPSSSRRKLPGGSVVKTPTAKAGEEHRRGGLVPGSGTSPGGENGNPLQYSCRDNPMDREACQATVHRVAKSGWIRLSDWTHTPTPTPKHTLCYTVDHY